MYFSWLDARGLQARDGQKQMIRFIANVLRQEQSRIGVVEAPTGTGKTIAYAVSTIPIAAAKRKHVVIVTATVALQDQIVNKDLPELRTCSEVGFSYVLAKGRQRYVCPLRLNLAASATDVQALEGLDGAGKASQRRNVGMKYVDLMSQFRQAKWNGDIDDTPIALESSEWSTVTTDSRGCTKNACSWYSKCPYYQARDQYQKSDVVVTNYDLLLTTVRHETDLLPAAQETIYVLDEAQHVEPKTMSTFALSFSLEHVTDRLPTVASTFSDLIKQIDEETLVSRCFTKFNHAHRGARGLQGELEKLLLDLDFGKSRERVRRFRFPNGEVPDSMRDVCAQLAKEYSNMVEAIVETTDFLKDKTQNERVFEASRVQAYLDAFNSATGDLEDWAALLRDFGQYQQDAISSRWVENVSELRGVEWRLKSVPIGIDGILKEALWNRAHGVILTSATLNSDDQFNHLKSVLGLDNDNETLVIDSPFDLRKMVTFNVPAMDTTPGADSGAHTKEVISRLPELLALERSALVLFTSKATMDEVWEGLPNRVKMHCLKQMASGKHALLRQHKRAIDSGEASYIFGLASYREGIDLPGDYCLHVIITRLPFDVPNDPIVESKDEILQNQGLEGFQKWRTLMLPDAILRMKQACGRLIRSESDTGRITVLDRRVVSRQYGKQILEALPPYRQEIE